MSIQFSSFQLLSRVQLCHPLDCSTPGFLVHHQLPELTQTRVHWVGDAIQPFILCHPFLLVPSIFPSIRVFSKESVLHIRWPKYWSFNFSISPPMNIQGWYHLRLTGLISLQSKGLSGVFFSTTIWKHQFFGTQPSMWSNSWCATIPRKLVINTWIRPSTALKSIHTLGQELGTSG